MSRQQVLQKKATHILDRLESLDSRFTTTPKDHPFAAEIRIGAKSLTGLNAILINEDKDLNVRLQALEAMGAILSNHPISEELAFYLGALARSKSIHPALRAGATRTLIISGCDEFIQAFEARLASKDHELVAAAAHAMGVAKRVKSVPALIELLAKNPSPLVKAEAARALGEIGDLAGLPILEAAFTGEVCLLPVIEALGKIGNDQTLAILTVALRDSSTEIRLAAAEAIASIIDRHPNGSYAGLENYLIRTLEQERDQLTAVILIACLNRIDAIVPQNLLARAIAGVSTNGAGNPPAMRTLSRPTFR